MANARTPTRLRSQSSGKSTAPAQTLSAEAVLDALKMILIGAPLNEVLTTIVRLIEAHSVGMFCSIFLLDEDGLHLRYAAAPNLPEAYRAGTDGACIGPNSGSCGTAAHSRQPVFVSDILSDPKWAGYREIARQSGLRASWSSPILSHDNTVLGTFCIYYRDVRSPGPDEVQLIDYASRIAGIAIERDRSQSALQQAYRELRQVIDFLPQHVVVLDAEGNLLQSNRMMDDYSGRPLAETQRVGTEERIKRDFHPDDVARFRSERREGFSKAAAFEIEARLLGKAGRHRWFLFRYNPLRNDEGRITRWFTTATDIEDRKHAELRMHNENLALREEIDRSSMYEAIVGSSEALRKVLSQIDKVAPTDSTVLILGETGTGKELIASALHKRSKRSARALIRVNCGAIPGSLILSELFGHEKGAFTGALQQRTGRFEAADGGTIFLDEVGELSAETQVALLRVLQEQQFERVGGSRSISVDTRVVAATNRDLETAVSAGKFRDDLFYRLNVFPIHVPSLRERRDDIPLLVEYLVERYAKRAGKRIGHVKKRTLDILQAYDWPGNVRELQNVVERAVILCEGETFSVDETWLHPTSGRRVRRPGVFADEKKESAERERKAIEVALAECQGRVSGPRGAAAILGIPHQTLESKIASLGIDKRRFKVPSRRGSSH
jgi:formate hydrogenlyase transcriptional activator